jgi:hypothetical protein
MNFREQAEANEVKTGLQSIGRKSADQYLVSRVILRCSSGPSTVYHAMEVVSCGGRFGTLVGKACVSCTVQCGMSEYWRMTLKVIGMTPLLDRYDEGTALLPVVSHKRLLPKSDNWPFLSLDEEGHDLPSDWFVPVSQNRRVIM